METSDEGLRALSEALGTALQAHGEVLTLAESCTGGWIAKVITDVAGSSAWFGRGYVTYADEAKRDLLGVRPATLAAHGAVSEATVTEMALGALARSGAGLAAAVSGVAGPTGGSEDKPVGTVWFGWARRGRAPVTRLERFEGDREAVRRQSVAVALAGAIALLDAERGREGETR